MPTVVIYASEAAAAAGLNPYKPRHEAVEQVWRRVDPVGHRDALVRNVHVQTEEQLVEKALMADECVRQGVVAAQAAAPETSTKAVLETQKVLDIISKSPSLTVAEQALVSKRVQSRVFTQYGTEKEDAVFQRLRERGMAIKKDAAFRKKVMGEVPGYGQVVWAVGGRFDALSEDGQVVVELKNRVRRLFNAIPAYERPQVEVYMRMLGVARACVVECYAPSREDLRLAVHEVGEDDAYWDGVLKPKLERFAALVCVLAFCDDAQIQDSYLNSEDREGWLDGNNPTVCP